MHHGTPRASSGGEPRGEAAGRCWFCSEQAVPPPINWALTPRGEQWGVHQSLPSQPPRSIQLCSHCCPQSPHAVPSLWAHKRPKGDLGGGGKGALWCSQEPHRILAQQRCSPTLSGLWAAEFSAAVLFSRLICSYVSNATFYPETAIFFWGGGGWGEVEALHQPCPKTSWLLEGPTVPPAASTPSHRLLWGRCGAGGCSSPPHPPQPRSLRSSTPTLWFSRFLPVLQRLWGGPGVLRSAKIWHWGFSCPPPPPPPLPPQPRCGVRCSVGLCGLQLVVLAPMDLSVLWGGN